MSQIGIKLANHDFFPIIDEDGKLPIEKELELTTIRDNQESVQINLFKKDGELEPLYIGSLIIEDLNKAPCGDATIVLKLTLDENKNLSAEAVDRDSGNKQSFSISMNELSQFSGVDFDFDAFEGTGEVASLNVSNLDSSIDDGFSFDDNEVNSWNEEKSEDVDMSFFDANDEKHDIDSFLEDSGTMPFEENPEKEVSDSEEFSVDTPSFEEENTEKYSDEDASSFEDFSSTEENKDEKEEDFLSDEGYESKKSSFPTWLKIFLIILIFGLLALIVALFLKNKMKEPKYEAETIDVIQQDAPPQTEQVVTEELSIDELTTEAPQREAEPFPIKEESVSNEGNLSNEVVTPATAEEIKKDVKIVQDGAIKKAVRYRVRWGDTLWDISGNYYKNPWAYKRIARYNKIKNPNKIIAGSYITIPAK